jgi:hypothetical protein
MSDKDEFPVEEVESPDVLPVAEIVDSESEADEIIPEITDPSWSDYVLTHFTEEELVEGYPTVDGLRRVGKKLLGKVVKSASKVIQYPTPENDFAAVCEHTLIIDWDRDDDASHEFPAREFTDVGEVSEFNCDPLYRGYPVSTASTRAEGRAWRKALGLRRILTAEEITKEDMPKMPSHAADAKINETQKQFINNVCRRNNINVMKFIGLSKEKYTNINEIPHASAVKIAATLAKFQNNKELIEKYGIGGYDPNWRNS